MLRCISSAIALVLICEFCIELSISVKSKMKSKEKEKNVVTTQALKTKTTSKKVVKKEPSLCKICMEEKPEEEIFDKNKCSHDSFCSDCISKHIAAKIEQNFSHVACPDVKCKMVFEPEACQSLVPKQVFDRWMDTLCEALVLGMNKVYCPFKDCSTIMLVDDEDKLVKESKCPESKCPSCRRLFCAQCKVPWHGDISCEDFIKLKKEKEEDDIMIELAKQKKWKRCPNCEFYVEKRSGCMHITCRCAVQFCYNCGKPWTQSHGGCVETSD